MENSPVLSTGARIATPVVATILLLTPIQVFGQAAASPNDTMWRAIDERSLDQTAKRLIVPKVYRTVRLNETMLVQTLAGAPMEFTTTTTAAQHPAIISLPMPDGMMARFRFEESPVM